MSVRASWGRGSGHRARHVAFLGALACASAVACQGKVIAFSSRQCATSAECVTAHGANWICRQSDGQCQSVVSADCPGERILGAENLGEPDVVVYGAIFALSGENSAIGKGEYDALQLAYDDIAKGGNGLPPLPGGTRRRPISVVVCDDASAQMASLHAVEHLTNDLGIQGIVGATWDGPAINFLGDPKGTVAAGALVIASGTTSPELTTHAKGSPSLFYRACESTAVEGVVIAWLTRDLEAKLGQSRGIAGKAKEALVYKGDSFGKGTAQVVAQNLTLNSIAAQDPQNSGNFLYADYGNPSDPISDPLKYADTVSKIVAEQPNIVLAMGTSEMFGQIMVPVEQQWPAGVLRPYWIFPHTGVTAALLAAMQTVGPNEGPPSPLATRVMGVTYGPNPHNPNSPGAANWQQFAGEFTASTPDGTSLYTLDATTTYDAFFTLAYLTVANGAQPMTGANLSSQMPKLIFGHAINVGPTDLNNALTLLAEGESIRITGTSGPLDFDMKTGDVHQENQVWCVPARNGGLPPFSGYGFDLANRPYGTIDLLAQSCGVGFW